MSQALIHCTVRARMVAVSETTKAKPRILCVEDEALMLDLLRHFVETAGYTFLEVMQHEHPDLVLLDLMLPEVDGAEVLLKKKEEPAIRDIPVVAVTALASPFDQIMWKRHTEIKDYITKPFKRQELLDTIERVLADKLA
jgi:CheY-like chemotaxis protein